MKWQAIFFPSRQNDSRWIGVLLSDMRKLSQTAPDVHLAFQERLFRLNCPVEAFAAVWTDMAHELSLNADVKLCGALNSTNKREAAGDEWFINIHIILSSTSEMCQMKSATVRHHNEDTQLRTVTDEHCSTVGEDYYSEYENRFVLADLLGVRLQLERSFLPRLPRQSCQHV